MEIEWEIQGIHVAYNWPIWTQKLPKEAQRCGLQKYLDVHKLQAGKDSVYAINLINSGFEKYNMPVKMSPSFVLVLTVFTTGYFDT